MTYSANDAISGLDTWVLDVDGTALTSGSGSASGTYDWDGGGLAAGTHTLTLQGTDLAGNATQSTLDITITVPAPAQPPAQPPAPGVVVIVPPVQRPRATNTPIPTATSGSAQLPGPAAQAAPLTSSRQLSTATTVRPVSSIRFENQPSAPVTPPASPAALPISNVLWGAQAAAAIAATAAYAASQRRKREEEEARAAAQAAAFNAAQRAREEEQRRAAAQAAQAAAASQAAQKTATKASQGGAYVQFMILKEAEAKLGGAYVQYMKRQEVLEAAEKKARKAAEEKAHKEAEAAEKARQEAAAVAAAAAAAIEANKPWWEKAWDGVKDTAEKVIKFVDEHQVEIAIGVGLVIGAAAIILTAGTATPFIVAAGAAALASGAVVGAGTIGLNAYYGRPLDQNLLRNFTVAVGASLVGSTSVVLLQGAAALGGRVLTQIGISTGIITEGASTAAKACEASNCDEVINQNIIEPVVDQVVNPALDAAGNLLSPSTSYDVLTLYDGMANGGSLPNVPPLENVATIGSFIPDDPGSYDVIARAMGAHYLNIPTAVWDAMTEAERQAANDAWLDYGISLDWSYYLTTKWSEIDDTSYLWTELQHLFEHGYTVSFDGKWLIPPP